MKIRNGFVSNSSSSSFVLFGVKVKPEVMLNNQDFKNQYALEIQKEQEKLNVKWTIKTEDPDFNKHKSVYEMCKSNGVSIPRETKDFFGYGFNGVFEPQKPDEKGILREMVYEGRFKYPKGVSTLSDDDVTYLGRVIADGDDYLDNASISLEKLREYTNELVILGFKEEDIKLYCGTRAC
jgi:hypothetical protein